MSETTKTIAITGAAGNLGGLLAKHLSDNASLRLNLLFHNKEIDSSLKNNPQVTPFKVDLSTGEGLNQALEGVDVVVHFAGVLFMHNPEKFLPLTNIGYFNNLIDVAISKGVKRLILISFPHVEGESDPQHPATGKLDGHPNSVHAATRLEEEKQLFARCADAGIEAVSLRVGMVYGRGILMVDTARWFSAHWLLGVWRKPNYIHLISTIDFLQATQAAILKPNIEGIYHIGDDGVQTLQEFLDVACAKWGTLKPWRMPLWMIMSAATVFEWSSRIFKIRAPLTKDFVRIGMVSYYGDTGRMRSELLGELRYPTLQDGVDTL